jgi:hypothetical protein
LQELTTATQCVRQVFPGSEVVANRTEAYPIEVKIHAETGSKKKGVEIWSGRQQSLFQKNCKQRDKSMKDIVANLNILKEELEEEDN